MLTPIDPIKKVLPIMIKKWGRIVNITGQAAKPHSALGLSNSARTGLTDMWQELQDKLQGLV